ncbi:MAG: PGPGW domain-containing protein [Sporichthyaceae bacterium]
MTDGPQDMVSAAAEARRRGRTHAAARKVALTTLGVVITLAGIAMLPLPGPGALIILVGLWVLAQEYEWAEKRLDVVQDKILDAAYATAASLPKTLGALLGASGMIAFGVVFGLNEDWPFSGWWTAGSIVGGGLLAGATAIWARATRHRRAASKAAKAA